MNCLAGFGLLSAAHVYSHRRQLIGKHMLLVMQAGLYGAKGGELSRSLLCAAVRSFRRCLVLTCWWKKRTRWSRWRAMFGRCGSCEDLTQAHATKVCAPYLPPAPCSGHCICHNPADTQLTSTKQLPAQCLCVMLASQLCTYLCCSAWLSMCSASPGCGEAT